MAKRASLIDHGRVELQKFADGLTGMGLPAGRPKFIGKRGEERYSYVTEWRDPKGRKLTLSVYTAPYLGARMSLWAGFSHDKREPVQRLADAYAAKRGIRDVPTVKLQDWNGLLLNRGMRSRVLDAGGVALEDYGERLMATWFGIYLPLDGHSADCAYEFVSDVLTMHRKGVKPRNGSPTEKTVERRERLTQGQFRADLIETWGGRCAVTGTAIQTVLQASHIKPWGADKRATVRNSPDNGLLLLPTLHRLFDEGYISFADDGGMLFADKFMAPERSKVGLKPSDCLQLDLNPRQIEFLALHRDEHGFPERCRHNSGKDRK